MGLTLQNSLTNLVATEASAAGTKATGLGKSLSTGTNQFVPVVDKFLGSSLTDNSKILGAVAKNTVYTSNILKTTGEYLGSIGTALQGALASSISASQVADDKVATLQKGLDDKLVQVNLLINTADFDGKNVLKGDVTNTRVQVGLSTTDVFIANVTDVSDNKLLRSSVTNALNDHIAVTPAAQATHYATAAHLATDIENNVNLVSAGLTDVGGAANGVGAMTDAEFEAALMAVVTAKPELGAFLNEALPTGLALVQTVGGANTRTFESLAAGDVTGLMGDAPSKAELLAVLKDGVATNLDTAPARAVTQDVITSALNFVRKEQAAVQNQQINLSETTDALRSTTNVTETAGKNYLATDYVQTAQDLSETIRQMGSSIASLQAMNKVSDSVEALVKSIR